MTWLTFGIGRLSWAHWRVESAVFGKRWAVRLGWTLLEPFGFLLAFGMGLGPMVSEIEGMPYGLYVAPGLIVMYVMYSALTSSAWSFFFKMEEKECDMILATPLSVEDLIGGELLWGATRGAVTAVACLVVFGCCGFVGSWWALGTIVVGFVLGWAFAGIGLFITSYIKALDQFDFMFPMVSTPAFVLSGIFFPVTGLPGWAQGLSWLLPTTYAVEPARQLWRGSIDARGIVFMAALIILAWGLTGAAVWRMRRRLYV